MNPRAPESQAFPRPLTWSHGAESFHTVLRQQEKKVVVMQQHPSSVCYAIVCDQTQNNLEEEVR